MNEPSTGLPDLLRGQIQSRKEPNSKKMREPFFPNGSGVTESYEAILGNLLKALCFNHNSSSTAKQVHDERP